MGSDLMAEVSRIQGLMERAREGEEFILSHSPLDIPSPLCPSSDVTKADLIVELEAKVKFYRGRLEEDRAELRIWESALRSALRGDSGKRESAAAKKPMPQEARGTKGKVSRQFVREVLRRNAKAGITPKQIREEADRQALAYSENFPYTILHKFRTQAKPEVREEGGRYYPLAPGQ
jgi:hypothetical protein